MNGMMGGAWKEAVVGYFNHFFQYYKSVICRDVHFLQIQHNVAKLLLC
jgi:hypothetical protein